MEQINLLYLALAQVKNLVYVHAVCLPKAPAVAVVTPPAPVMPHSELPPQLLDVNLCNRGWVRLEGAELSSIASLSSKKFPADKK